MVKEDYSNLQRFSFNSDNAAGGENEPYVDEDVLAERKRREKSIKRQQLIEKKKREAAAQGMLT